MNTAFATVARLVVVALFAAGIHAVLPAQDAFAHGGRIKPPEPNFKPGDGRMPGRVPTDPPPIPHPPRIPTDPTPPNSPPWTPGPGDSLRPGRPTPTTPAPKGPTGLGTPNTPTPRSGTPARPTAGAAGRRTGAGTASPWLRWEMWWALNRWRFFPNRGETLQGDAVVTPGSKGNAGQQAAAGKRTIVTRQQIVPFLVGLLDPERKTRDEVRAAAMIALAKVTHEAAAVELIFKHAEDLRASNLVRESAALAIGMLRRGNETSQLDGVRLDRARRRLLVLLDDKDAPDRTRAFAALSIGMLGDQPFGSAFTKDGRMIARALWSRAIRKHSRHELPIALLTAVGMQPRGGTSAEIRADLQRIVHGRRIGRRKWDAEERSHALSALVRQEGAGWPVALFRVLTSKRVPAQVRQAAFIALGAKSTALSAEDRLNAVEAADRGLRLSRDNLSRGLGLIALGRIVHADVEAGSSVVVERTGACGRLLGDARHGAYAVRGFAALGLALAVRKTTSSDMDVTRFVGSGREVLARGFERSKDARARSAYAVALGLLGRDAPTTARTVMAGVLADRRADPDLRGHVAISLAQIGDRSSPVRKAMRTALWDRRSVELRSRAALALSFLGGRAETRMLIQELRNARSQWVLQQVAAALGQLGDVDAVPAILEVAADVRRGEEARALAVASLGLLGDPEPKPSMLQLTLDANYPARTDSLHEAFSIL